jgi:hypothetical protein
MNVKRNQIRFVARKCLYFLKKYFYPYIFFFVFFSTAAELGIQYITLENTEMLSLSIPRVSGSKSGFLTVSDVNIVHNSHFAGSSNPVIHIQDVGFIFQAINILGGSFSFFSFLFFSVSFLIFSFSFFSLNFSFLILFFAPLFPQPMKTERNSRRRQQHCSPCQRLEPELMTIAHVRRTIPSSVWTARLACCAVKTYTPAH